MSYYRKIFELISEAALLEKSKESRLKDFELKQKHGLLAKRKGDFGEKKGWLHIPGIQGKPGTGEGGQQSYKFNRNTYEKQPIIGKHSTGGKKRGMPKGPLHGTIGRGEENRTKQGAIDRLRHKLHIQQKTWDKNPNWKSITSRRPKKPNIWSTGREEQ